MRTACSTNGRQFFSRATDCKWHNSSYLSMVDAWMYFWTWRSFWDDEPFLGCTCESELDAGSLSPLNSVDDDSISYATALSTAVLVIVVIIIASK